MSPSLRASCRRRRSSRRRRTDARLRAVSRPRPLCLRAAAPPRLRASVRASQSRSTAAPSRLRAPPRARRATKHQPRNGSGWQAEVLEGGGAVTAYVCTRMHTTASTPYACTQLPRLRRGGGSSSSSPAARRAAGEQARTHTHTHGHANTECKHRPGLRRRGGQVFFVLAGCGMQGSVDWSVSVCVRACPPVRLSVRAYLHTCMRACVCVCVCVCARARVCASVQA